MEASKVQSFLAALRRSQEATAALIVAVEGALADPPGVTATGEPLATVAELAGFSDEATAYVMRHIMWANDFTACVGGACGCGGHSSSGHRGGGHLGPPWPLL